MSTTYGLEAEFFVKRKGSDEFVSIPSSASLPHDACGYLAEARGQPHSDPRVARHLLNAAVESLSLGAAKAGLVLVKAATAPVSPEMRRVALRSFGKQPSQSYFAHGGAYRSSRPRAGLHIHFGNEQIFTYDNGRRFTYQGPINMPRIIWFLDQAFKDEIKAAGRVPGEYEMKPHGFEYRSLPATVDLDKVVAVLEELRWGNTNPNPSRAAAPGLPTIEEGDEPDGDGG